MLGSLGRAARRLLRSLARPVGAAQGRSGVALLPYRGYGSREEIFLTTKIFKGDFAHRSLLIFGASRVGCAAEGPKQHIGDRAVHRFAHQDRKNKAREPIECAGDDENLVV